LAPRAADVLALRVDNLVSGVSVVAQAFHNANTLRVKSLAVDARLFSGRPDLGDALVDGLDDDFFHLHAFVVVDLEFFVNHARRALDSNRFLRRLLGLVAAEQRLLIDLRG